VMAHLTSGCKSSINLLARRGEPITLCHRSSRRFLDRLYSHAESSAFYGLDHACPAQCATADRLDDFRQANLT
jgi:hypothetical protein